jgi:hemerythrin superfamily protein
MGLTDQLHDEHQQILAVFDQLDKTKDTSKIKELTKQLMDVAAVHIKTEEEQLYPSLAGSQSQEVRQTAAIFYSLMEQYAAEFMAIIKIITDSQGPLSQNNIDDFAKIRTKFRDRVAIEETLLFAAYNGRKI